MLNKLDVFLNETATRYGKMFYIKTDRVIGDTLENYGEWAQNEIDLIKEIIPSDSIVYDIGANIGAVSLGFSKHFKSVHAFECQPVFCEIIRKNIEINNANNVTLHECGLGRVNDAIHIKPLILEEYDNYGALRLSASDDKEQNKVDVIIKRLDDMSLGQVDFIKIDAETMEPEIIRGSYATIARYRPILYVEANNSLSAMMIFEEAKIIGYDIFLHLSAAHNRNNYKNYTPEKEEIFNYYDKMLLLVPKEKSSLIPAELHNLVRLNNVKEFSLAASGNNSMDADEAFFQEMQFHIGELHVIPRTSFLLSEIKNLRQENDTIKRSLSMRITKPLRNAKNFVQKLIGHKK